MIITPGRQHICLMCFVCQPLICTRYMEENIHTYYYLLHHGNIIMGASNPLVLIIKNNQIILILPNMNDVYILHAF